MIVPFWLAYLLVRRIYRLQSVDLYRTLGLCESEQCRMGACACRQKSSPPPASNHQGGLGHTSSDRQASGHGASSQAAISVTTVSSGNPSAITIVTSHNNRRSPGRTDPVQGSSQNAHCHEHPRSCPRHQHRSRQRNEQLIVDSLVLETLKLIRTLVDL